MKHQQAASMLQRPPLHQMTDEQLLAWIRATRVALRKKMQRERAYLDRRAARKVSTPTDEAYEADQLLEADLLALLDEIEQANTTRTAESEAEP